MKAQYPGFVAFQWHVVDGYGLERLRKDETTIILGASHAAPLLELIVNVPEEPFVTTDFVYEQGWYCAEREGDEWNISLEGGRGQFTITHESLLRVQRVIRAMQRGLIPEDGEAIDADEWDRRFGWAKESGLLTSRLAGLDELARQYVERLRNEGVVPGRSASEELIAARLAITEALEREGVTNRPQPDAIFYHLREQNADCLKEVLDALDMQYELAQRAGLKAAETNLLPVALDWWIIDPDYPSNRNMGTIDFTEFCCQIFERRKREPYVDPIPVEVHGQQMYLLSGLVPKEMDGETKRRLELRSAMTEEAFLKVWMQRLRVICDKMESLVVPVWEAEKLAAADAIWHFPKVLRIFLERFSNGGQIDSLRYLSGEEILQENDLARWSRPCPAEIRDAHDFIDWESDTLPDGLLCISHCYYNASRVYLLADGRAVWATPNEENGYTIDPPCLWLWD